MWWYERSQDRRDATGGDLAKLEVQFDEQRRFFMLEIDKARQEKKAIELELVKAQGQIERYKKIFKDGAPPFL